jgi:hypothetical protein
VISDFWIVYFICECREEKERDILEDLGIDGRIILK